MSNYRTPDKFFSLLFDDNQEDSNTSDRLDDDNDCSDCVPSGDDNKKDIILSNPENDSRMIIIMQKLVTNLVDILQTPLLHFSHQRAL